jgi:predicted  nucleic acid-binding Zn-ribbon protein
MLTQEEARMASAQVLEVANTINNEVREIADNVLVVDNRVACVDDRVKDVDDRVKAVDDKLAAVTDGVQYNFSQSSKIV